MFERKKEKSKQSSGDNLSNLGMGGNLGGSQMFYWIYDYPTKYIGALFVLAFVAATWRGIIFLRPIVRSRIHYKRSANDMVGFALSSFSVLYSLLLGLIALSTWA
jgi:hypothetical protein